MCDDPVDWHPDLNESVIEGSAAARAVGGAASVYHIAFANVEAKVRAGIAATIRQHVHASEGSYRASAFRHAATIAEGATCTCALPAHPPANLGDVVLAYGAILRSEIAAEIEAFADDHSDVSDAYRHAALIAKGTPGP